MLGEVEMVQSKKFLIEINKLNLKKKRVNSLMNLCLNTIFLMTLLKRLYI